MASEPTGSGGPERRKHRRYERQLTFSHGGEENFPVLETLNVSEGGCLCRVDRYIAPMTVFRIMGEIPGSDTGFQADAVVVRVDPEQEIDNHTDYQVALFFQRMEDLSRQSLQHYLAS